MAKRSPSRAARSDGLAGTEAPLSVRGERARSAKERAALAELVEVERAIAALEGRNVEDAEQMMMLRRDAEKRRANLERIIAESHAAIDRRQRLLPWKIAGVVVVLGAVAGGGAMTTPLVRARLAERERALAAATVVAEPFAARFRIGQTAVDDGLAVAAPAGKCFIAVAAGAQGAAPIRVERQGMVREAIGSVGWCSCKAEEVAVTASGPAPVATLLLEAAASAIGGADGLAGLAPRPAAAFPETVERACAEAAFDAWAQAQPRAARAPATLSREEQMLVADGLAAVTLAGDDVPFVLPPESSESCWLALGRSGQPLSLRRSGGERPLAVRWGALGFCAKEATGLSVWREGGGEVILFAAPRARLGGLLGLREAAARMGVPIAAWTAPDELEADARATLAASGIGAAPLGIVADRGAVFAISTDARSILAPSDVGRDAACRPALAVGAGQAMCVEARSHAFQPVGALPLAVAGNPRPLWLVPAAAPDPAELARSLDLLAFARRLSAQGYELTTLVGAALTRDGATVTGRSGEKEIIAVTVSAKPPYLHTLSAGPPWTLAEPRPTALVPGVVLKLRATPAYPPPAAKREFVVWRR